MISVTLTNEMLRRILAVEEYRSTFPTGKIAPAISSKLRKNSKKKSSYSSTRIEGNPLTEEQADEAIESGKRHLLKPEEEVRNYYLALEYLEQRLTDGAPFDKNLLLEVQKRIVKGEGSDKVGIRGPMPPGVLFAVYDSETGLPEYIPPEAKDVEPLLDELFEYVKESDDHPLVKAAVIHYQLVTIHPFEDGNGRTARAVSRYYLDLCGFDFGGIGSLEEYFAYDVEEYYASLQMGLPALYYDGRDNPPQPEIWVEYFLHMVELYAQRASHLAEEGAGEAINAALSHVKPRELELYNYLVANGIQEFAPIDMARVFGVSNRTIINRCAALANVGLLEPQLVKERIRSYRVIKDWEARR